MQNSCLTNPEPHAILRRRCIFTPKERLMIEAGIQVLLKTKKLTETARLPTRAHPTDAGLDLYADEDAELTYGDIAVISTGIAIELPHGTVGLILDRSSMGKKGIKVFGGVIDSNYRGELLVGLGRATSSMEAILEMVEIQKGDKIAQLVIVPIILATAYEVNELTETDRGEKRFGSSGR